MTLTYDPKKSTPEKLGETITKLGYTVEVVANPKPKPATDKAAAKPQQMPVPKNTIISQIMKPSRFGGADAKMMAAMVEAMTVTARPERVIRRMP